MEIAISKYFVLHYSMVFHNYFHTISRIISIVFSHWYLMIPCRRSLASWVLWWAAQAARWWDAASQRLGGSSPKLNEWCFCLPSGNFLHSYWKWPFIVDFPIENSDFPKKIYGKSQFLMGKSTINMREIHQLKTVVNPIGLNQRVSSIQNWWLIGLIGFRWPIHSTVMYTSRIWANDERSHSDRNIQIMLNMGKHAKRKLSKCF